MCSCYVDIWEEVTSGTQMYGSETSKCKLRSNIYLPSVTDSTNIIKHLQHTGPEQESHKAHILMGVGKKDSHQANK